MKVALFSDCYIPIINGVVTLVSQLREGLTLQGHEVLIFTVRYRGYKQNEPGTLRFPSLPFSVGNQNFGFGLVSTGYVQKVLRDWGVDLIHSHTEFALDAVAIKAAKKLGVPYIHTYHTMWESYLHYLPKWVISPGLVRMLYRNHSKSADAIIAPSLKAKDYLLALVPAAPVVVVPNGINVQKFRSVGMTQEVMLATRAKYGIAEDEKVLLFVGRIGPEKRVIELQQALLPVLRANPKVKVAMIGDGGDIGTLQQIASREGLADRLLLPGFIEWKDIYGIYSLASIFVTASLSEVHPMTVIEALVCGLPVVSRRDASYLDQVYPGENGELVDSENELTDAVNALLADPDRLSSYAARSLEVAKKFTAEGHVGRTLDLYQEVLKTYH